MSHLAARTHFVMVSHYNKWASRRILDFCSPTIAFNQKLSPSDKIAPVPFIRDLNMPCGSIYNTLCHMYAGDLLWQQRYTSQPSDEKLNELWSGESYGNQWSTFFAERHGLDVLDPLNASRADVMSHFMTLRSALDEMSNQWINHVQGTTDPALFQELKYTTTDGTDAKLQRSFVLHHVFNHATHHRGQISATVTRFSSGNVIGDPIIKKNACELDMTSFLPIWREIHAKAFKWA
eukprot:GDKJ01035090.1.p1 GENE.GDKJ01035090.1~~GDKJ01035090.1.p1  ORF type:complete len:247 (+),score=31.17 GDKJ01035090.1:39-743(+)